MGLLGESEGVRHQRMLRSERNPFQLHGFSSERRERGKVFQKREIGLNHSAIALSNLSRFNIIYFPRLYYENLSLAVIFLVMFLIISLWGVLTGVHST